MRKQETGSRKAYGRAVLAAILCAVVAMGVWAVFGERSRIFARGLSSATADRQDKNSNTVSPFYCHTRSLSIEEWAHKIRISAKMRNARVEIKELADGYAFRFQPGGVSLVELADWVDSEVRCCPFFDMAISVERDGGPVWLMLRGKDGVKQFIRSEFKLDAR